MRSGRYSRKEKKMIDLALYEDQFMTIDRITEGIAVLELPDDKMEPVKASELPAGIKEGYVLKVVNAQFVIDMKEYDRRLKEMEEMMKGFFN